MTTVAIVVDVSNLYYCVKKEYEKKVDYKAFKEYVSGFGDIKKCVAFGAQRKEEAAGFIQALQHFGFECRFKSPKEYMTDGVVKRKADWDVSIALELIELAREVDLIVLGCADGDLSPAVLEVQKMGKRVLVIGTGISSDLRDITDCVEIPPSMLES